MGLFVLGGIVVAVATVANNEEESPLLWGLLALICGVIGGMVFGIIGQLCGGAAAFGLMQLKIARFG